MINKPKLIQYRSSGCIQSTTEPASLFGCQQLLRTTAASLRQGQSASIQTTHLWCICCSDARIMLQDRMQLMEEPRIRRKYTRSHISERPSPFQRCRDDQFLPNLQSAWNVKARHTSQPSVQRCSRLAGRSPRQHRTCSHAQRSKPSFRRTTGRPRFSERQPGWTSARGHR